MRETSLDLLLLTTILLLTPVSFSLVIECGECRAKQISSQCVKLMAKGVEYYEEHPLGSGQQCSSLGFEVPLMVFSCAQKKPEQCQMRKPVLSKDILGQRNEELGEFLDHLTKSRELAELKIQKWCTCKYENQLQSKHVDVQIRYLQKAEAAKATPKEKGDQDEYIQVQNHTYYHDEYSLEDCDTTCVIIVICCIAGVYILVIVIVLIATACKRDEDGIVHNPPPPPDQPPVQEPGFQMQPQPFQPASPVYGIPEQPQPGSERQFQNQANPW